MPGGKEHPIFTKFPSRKALWRANKLGRCRQYRRKETFRSGFKRGPLYFASDGHVGLGGLDIYVAELRMKAITIKDSILVLPSIHNMTTFVLVINSSTGLGYFASNRPGGKGEDDIYSLNKHTAYQELHLPYREVRDEDTDDLIVEAKVVLWIVTITYSKRPKVTLTESLFWCNQMFYGICHSRIQGKFSTSEKSFVTSGEYESTVKRLLYLLEEDKEIKDAKVGQDLGSSLTWTLFILISTNRTLTRCTNRVIESGRSHA